MQGAGVRGGDLGAEAAAGQLGRVVDAAAAAQRGHVLRGHHPQQPRIPVSIQYRHVSCIHTFASGEKTLEIHLLLSCVCSVLGEWVF